MSGPSPAIAAARRSESSVASCTPNPMFSASVALKKKLSWAVRSPAGILGENSRTSSRSSRTKPWKVEQPEIRCASVIFPLPGMSHDRDRLARGGA